VILLLLGAATLVVAFWLLMRLRSLLVMLLISFFLSFALEPPANLLARRGWRRGVATGAVFAALVLGMALLVAAFGSLLLDQLGALVGLVLQSFTVGLFTFYLIADGPRLRRTVCSVLPPGHQEVALRVWDLAIESTGGYVYSRALLAAVSAVTTTLFLALIGVPYPLALGFWVGLVSQFIPTIGTYLAGALPVLIALLDNPVSALWVLIFIVVYQQFENMVLSPRITARTMALHPAVAFGAVIAGGAIMGPIGALLALPAAASVQALVSIYLHRYEVIASPLTATPHPARRVP
jgi:predicted PurR-regulated permease PerM